MTDPNASKKQSQKSRISAYARFSGIAFQMIAIIVLGTFGGVKLDEAFPNEYAAWTIVCSFLSVIVAMVYIIRRVNSNKDTTSK